MAKQVTPKYLELATQIFNTEVEKKTNRRRELLRQRREHSKKKQPAKHHEQGASRGKPQSGRGRGSRGRGRGRGRHTHHQGHRQHDDPRVRAGWFDKPPRR